MFFDEKFLFSKLLRQNWIPKSTEIPINKTAKATEIMFKLPIKNVVRPKVMNNPKIIVMTKRAISIKFLNAKNKIMKTTKILKTPAFEAPFTTESASS